MSTKIFCDIADLDLIKKFNKKKIVKGFTTNPSLIRKAGAKDYEHYSKKILKICKNKPVSLEVFADNFSEMKDQGYVINSWVQMEGSIEERGLHLVFIMKTFIWLFSFLVSLQSIATIINSFHIIKSSKKG